MDRNFARSLPLVLKHEGGWADNPKDPGGPTQKGVTLATFRRYVKADATKADLKAITDEQISTVYYRHYWAAVQAPQLPSGVDYAVFDFAVNSGPDRAAKYLQKIAGVKQDGRIGPATIAAVNKLDAAKVVAQLCDDRLAFLKRLKTWSTFGKGWERRVNDVRATALKWVGNSADVKLVEIPVEVQKPVIPEKIERQVKEKSGFLAQVTGGGGLGAIGLSWLAGMDWEAVLAAIVGLAFVILILILLRTQLVSMIRQVRAELAE